AEEMLDLVIGSDESGRQLFLKDVATVKRGDQDPPRRLLRYDGKPAIGLGISTVTGGNVVRMGEALRESWMSPTASNQSASRSEKSISSPKPSLTPLAISCSTWLRR